jgi:hypothetical protein
MLVVLDTSLEECLADTSSAEYDRMLTEINALAAARRAGKVVLFCSSDSLIDSLINDVHSTPTTKST